MVKQSHMPKRRAEPKPKPGRDLHAIQIAGVRVPPWRWFRSAAEKVRARGSGGRAPGPSLSPDVRPTATWAEERLVGRTSSTRCPTTCESASGYSVGPPRLAAVGDVRGPAGGAALVVLADGGCTA